MNYKFSSDDINADTKLKRPLKIRLINNSENVG